MKRTLGKVFLLLLTLCLMWSGMAITASAANMKLNKTTATVPVGKKVKLKVKGTKKKVTWESSRKDVATVDAKGKVKAWKAGETMITAKVNGKTFRCAVTVIEKDYSIIEEIVEASVGDLVTFGSYEQDNDMTNGAEAIQWQVLNKKDGKVLLLSKYALTQQQFHNKEQQAVWESCFLRSWLNEEFYQIAFTGAEQKFIAESYLLNEDNPKHRTDGGDPTYDKVFLLSLDEIKTYFGEDLAAEDPARGAQLTEYAKAQGGLYSRADGYYGNGWWWLRTPGSTRSAAMAVCKFGDVDLCGFYINDQDCVVRPALWLEVE